MAIDQNYYRASLPIYFTDLILSTAGFVLCFLWCLHAGGAAFALAFFLAAAFLYRAGAFVHELTHPQRNPRFKPFAVLWNLSVGAMVQVPAVRFFHPHLTAHHMYPGVPYHNLPALHAELKQSDEEYRKRVVPFLAALRGPGWEFGGGR